MLRAAAAPPGDFRYREIWTGQPWPVSAHRYFGNILLMVGWASLIGQGIQDTWNYAYAQQAKGVQPSQKWQTEHDLLMWKRNQAENRSLRKTQYQTAVKDARKAGLHPLFAMGAGGVGGPAANLGGGDSGPTPSQPPAPPQQHLLAEGIKGLATRGERKQQIELGLARQRVAVARDQVELMKASSEAAILKQRAEAGLRVDPEHPSLWTTYIDDDGNPVRLLNEQAAESMEGVGATAAGAYRQVRDLPRNVGEHFIERERSLRAQGYRKDRYGQWRKVKGLARGSRGRSHKTPYGTVTYRAR